MRVFPGRSLIFVVVISRSHSSSGAAFPGGPQCVERRSGRPHLQNLVDRQRIARVKATFVAAWTACGLARQRSSQYLKGAALAPQDVALARLTRGAHISKFLINRANAAFAQLSFEALTVPGIT